MPLTRFIKAVWRYVRETAGEEDYRRHREWARAHGQPALDPAAFYLSRLERKYARPNRCC